jgi:putative tricarboxylic transport membrane protein
MFENLMLGMEHALTLNSLFFIFLGVTWGIIGGAIPGITGSIACALLLPFTWAMEPAVALMMLAGVYVGAEYGGSIPAILIGAPGTSACAATVLDGYPMHKKGETGKALGTSLITGTIGGMFSVVVLITVSVPLASVALAFGPPEYFTLSLFAITVVSSLVSNNLVKGLMSALFGLFLAVIGLDHFTAEPRFTGGIVDLVNGLELIPVLIGLFAVSELLVMAGKMTKELPYTKNVSTKFPSLSDLKQAVKATAIGSVLGTFFGIMPGVGGSVGSWVAYFEARRWSRHKEKFGMGAIEGIAASESANNAVTGGALVPLLALGIPGSNSTAVMLGALIIHGVVPGPLMFEQHPEIPYGVFIGMFMAQMAMLIVGYFVLKPATLIGNVSTQMLLAAIFPLVFVGSYSINNSIFDVIVVLAFGVIGYIMKQYNFSPPATVLGFVLGGYIEVNLRRGLAMSNGDYMIFINRPISLLLLVLAVLSLFAPLIQEKLMEKIVPKTGVNLDAPS